MCVGCRIQFPANLRFEFFFGTLCSGKKGEGRYYKIYFIYYFIASFLFETHGDLQIYKMKQFCCSSNECSGTKSTELENYSNKKKETYLRHDKP